MRALLDTHVFLWALDNPSRLPSPIVSIFSDADSELFLSTASAWEIAIKHQLGKLTLPMAVVDYLKTRCDALGIESLPIRLEHATAVATLPAHHRDPFDRMLVVQAVMENLTLATLDPIFSRYKVRRVPAALPKQRRR